MISPPRWTESQLAAQAEAATESFRRERLAEPLERWKDTFDKYRAQFRRLFEAYGIADPVNLSHAQITEIFEQRLGDALRYLAGPPISIDDLKGLARASLAPGSVAANPAAA